jgi:hypothetical protein
MTRQVPKRIVSEYKTNKKTSPLVEEATYVLLVAGPVLVTVAVVQVHAIDLE